MDFTVLAQLTHDVTVGPVAFDYPWGDGLADEVFAYAFLKVGAKFAKQWGYVESSRAVNAEEYE